MSHNDFQTSQQLISINFVLSFISLLANHHNYLVRYLNKPLVLNTDFGFRANYIRFCYIYNLGLLYVKRKHQLLFQFYFNSHLRYCSSSWIEKSDIGKRVRNIWTNILFCVRDEIKDVFHALTQVWGCGCLQSIKGKQTSFFISQISHINYFKNMFILHYHMNLTLFCHKFAGDQNKHRRIYYNETLQLIGLIRDSINTREKNFACKNQN